MSVKTITVTIEAYRKLRRAKRPGESFTDVINRIMGGPSVLELAGILDEEAGARMEEAIQEIRRDFDDRLERTTEAMKR
ncbi:MAG: antitoxin VapB family protein [Thermoplasmata archaeon]